MLLAVLLARNFGAANYGLFVFAVGVSVIAGIFAGFGWPNLLNREMPRLIREESWGRLRGLNRAADASVVSIALAIAAFLIILSFVFPEFSFGLWVGALLGLPAALTLLRQQQLFSVDRPALAMMLDQGMTATVVLLIFLINPMTVEMTLVIYGLVSLVLSGTSTVVVRARLPLETWSAKPVYCLKEWYASGAALLSATLPRLLVTRLDVVLVAPLAGLFEAGLFGSAFRLSLLMTFPQFIMQSLITPRFGRAFAAEDYVQVRRLSVITFAFAALTAAPFLLPALLAPTLVMHFLFGAEFAAGGPTLFWLGAGQFIAAFGVGLSTMIAMGGDHKAMGRQGVAIAIVTLTAGVLVVPVYGAVGGAVVLAASNALWVGGMAWLSRPILGRDRNLAR